MRYNGLNNTLKLDFDMTNPIIGKKAPAFSLKTDQGETVKLSDFIGKNVVLYFYPKDDTPGCTKEACDFRDNLKSFKKTDTVILGVSGDSVEKHTRFKDKYSLPFTLLSDPDFKVCKAYDVYKQKSMYGKKYYGIERSTFLIDAKGKLVKEYRKVSVSGHIEEILAEIKSHYS
jgi:peroxiredoxin Q/BCP